MLFPRPILSQKCRTPLHERTQTGFYWKYSTMQSYKLCGHLIPFNISRSSKVLTFLCHGETFNVLNFSIHCKIISRLNNFVCVLLKYLKSLGCPQRLRCHWKTLPLRGSGISPPRQFPFLGKCLIYLDVVRIDQNAWYPVPVSQIVGKTQKKKAREKLAGQKKGKRKGERACNHLFYDPLTPTFGTFEIIRFRLSNCWNVSELESFSNFRRDYFARRLSLMRNRAIWSVKSGSVGNTRLLHCARMLLVPVNIFSYK